MQSDEKAGKSGSAGVGAAWQKAVSSPDTSYATRKVPLVEVEYFSLSDYVRNVVEALAQSGGRSILEAGCGSGKLSLALAFLGYEVTALDISADVLSNLTSNAARLESESERSFRIRTVCFDLERMPFDEGAFDAVTNEGVVEHWTDRAARVDVIREMGRVVRPGGRVIIYVPNGRHPLRRWWKLTRYPGYRQDDAVPWFRYDCPTLEQEMSEAGLRHVRTDGISPYSSLRVWPDLLPLRAAASLMERFLPHPPFIRRRMGFNLSGIGTKPE